MRIRFTIKVPKGARKTFAVVKDVKYADGRRSQTTVDDEAVDALNRNMLAGLIGQAEAEIQLRDVIKVRLEKQAGVQDKKDLEETVSEQNLAVFRKFWTHLTMERSLKNPVSSRNDLLAALRAIEPLSLTVATRPEIKAKLDKQTDKRYRRHAIRINQLLGFLGREIALPLKKLDQEEVHYLTWDELKSVLPHLPYDSSRILAQVLFCTGVRIGEAFKLTLRKLKPNNSVFINQQLTYDLKERAPKNGKLHDTVLLPQGRVAYEQWCLLPEAERVKLRNIFSNQLLAASRRVFPDKERHVSAHDLRHSYAVYLLERRATVTEIASLLGDTEAVVRKHYTGWVQSDRMVENLNLLLKNG